jgi:hypothetical protein
MFAVGWLAKCRGPWHVAVVPCVLTHQAVSNDGKHLCNLSVQTVHASACPAERGNWKGIIRHGVVLADACCCIVEWSPAEITSSFYHTNHGWQGARITRLHWPAGPSPSTRTDAYYGVWSMNRRPDARMIQLGPGKARVDQEFAGQWTTTRQWWCLSRWQLSSLNYWLCLVPPKNALYKKKIPRHIKLMIHAWITKCR